MRQFRWIGPLAVVAGIAWIFFVSRPPQDTLLIRSKVVLGNGLLRFQDGFQWVTHDRIVAGSRGGEELLRINPDSAESPLDRQIKSALGRMAPGYPFLSPNLRWCIGDQKGGGKVRIERLDTGSGMTFIRPDWAWFADRRWLPDSSRLVIRNTGGSPVLRKYDPMTDDYSRPVTPDMPKYSPLGGFRGGNLASPSGGSFAARWTAPEPMLLGVTSRDTAILTTWRQGQRHDVDLFEVSLDRSGKPIRTFTIPIKHEERVDAVALSPAGTRAALQIYTGPARFSRWISRLLPRMQAAFPANVEIRVTSLHDGATQSLGFVRTPEHAYSRSSRIPHSLQWHPDGKQVSFVYDAGVYLAETD